MKLVISLYRIDHAALESWWNSGSSRLQWKLRDLKSPDLTNLQNKFLQFLCSSHFLTCAFNLGRTCPLTILVLYVELSTRSWFNLTMLIFFINFERKRRANHPFRKWGEWQLVIICSLTRDLGKTNCAIYNSHSLWSFTSMATTR